MQKLTLQDGRTKCQKGTCAIVRSFDVLALAVITSLATTYMANASSQLPLIEPGQGPKPAPPGYRWYIVRNWKHVYTGKASMVQRGANVGPTFDPDELIFGEKAGDAIRQRDPRVPGEVSHILLPASYELPADVAALRAPPPPSSLPEKEKFDFSQVTFIEEPTPPGTPKGFTAYRFVLPRLVYTGTVDTLRGSRSAFVISGSGLRIRRAKYPGEASHVLVPSNIVLPDVLRRRPR